MPKVAFEPCNPTRGAKVPFGPDWLHGIKQDGYRLIVQREGRRVRVFTRNGHDWTDRYPLIESALKNRTSSFVIDGEAVLLGLDGISDFNGLHSRRYDDEVPLYAFDILAIDGDDLRKQPLHLRKTNLARLLARPFEQGEIGGPVPEGLRVRPRRPGLEAPRQHLPIWPVTELDQGEEPHPSGDGSGQGVVLTKRRNVKCKTPAGWHGGMVRGRGRKRVFWASRH
jgi:bifunctional non-homologous end joining protein LigD